MSQCEVCRCCCDGHPSHKKDSTWAWMVCLGAGMNMAFSFGLIYSFGVLLPVFMDYFKESRERTAWVGSLSVAFAFSAGPFVGFLINHFGCRAVSMTGCMICALALTVASFAESLITLFVSYAILGIGGGGVFLSSIVIIRHCFDKRQSIAFGIASAGQGVGTMVLSQVIQSLVTAVHWRNTLRIVAGSLFLNSFFGILYDSKIQVENASSNEVLSCENVGHEERSRRFLFHCSVWKVPGFLVLAASASWFMFGRATNYVHLVKYAQDLGTSSNASSRLILYLGITTAIGRFVCGFVCSIQWLNNWYILQSMSLVQGISMMLLTLAQNYTPLVAYAFVFGFCDGALATVFNIQSITCVDQPRAASAFGYLLFIGSVTSLVGPPISGLIADNVGSYGPAFLMSGGLLITGSLIPFVLFCVKRPTEQNREELLIYEEITGNVEEGEERNNLDKDGIIGSVKQTRNSVNGELEVLNVSSV